MGDGEIEVAVSRFSKFPPFAFLCKIPSCPHIIETAPCAHSKAAGSVLLQRQAVKVEATGLTRAQDSAR